MLAVVVFLVAGAFFWLLIPFKVPITVFFVGGFFAGAATCFRVIVVELVESLASLAFPLPTLGAEAGGAALFPRPPFIVEAVLVALRVAAPIAVAVSVALRLAAERVVLAFSTMCVRIPAALSWGAGALGLRGETGRERKLFAGETGRIGECGSVREFADLGERTCDGLMLTRDEVCTGGSGAPRSRFLGFSMSSFSLSIEISVLGRVSKPMRVTG